MSRLTLAEFGVHSWRDLAEVLVSLVVAGLSLVAIWGAVLLIWAVTAK